jgi:hypothetical protein
VLLDLRFVVIAAFTTLLILLFGADWQGVYANPLFLAIYATLIGGLLFSRMVVDLSHREAEQEARRASQSEAHYRLITDHASDLICLVNFEVAGYHGEGLPATGQYGGRSWCAGAHACRSRAGQRNGTGGRR